MNKLSISPLVAICLTALCLTVALPSHAITQPLPGAVSFPANVPLHLPMPAGYDIRVLSGYGPAAASSLHDGLNNAGSANDYYALDLVYEGEPNFGKGLPIVASLPGEVVKAGWASAGWANYGQRVILRHDLGDGHVYHTIYCHLDSITVSEGMVLTQGQTLGTLGQSCQGQLSCGSFSTPHLHWAIHRDSTIGGSGTGGSYGGNAVVPEVMDGAEDLFQGMIITSQNVDNPVCGDGFCSGDEDHDSCPDDCPICAPIPPEGRIVDESESLCFAAGGTPQYWHQESAGYGDSLLWTLATDDSQIDNFGLWELTFEMAGDYLVEVYTEAAFAQSVAAAYKVTHAGSTETVVIDQTAVDGWQPLGSFYFDAGGSQRLRLDDVTGEPLSDAKQIVFDAIRLTGPGGGGSGGSSASGTGGGSSASSSGSGGSSSSSGSGGSSSSGLSDGGADDGCGCRSAGAPSAPHAGWALLVGLLGVARRRRSSRG